MGESCAIDPEKSDSWRYKRPRCKGMRDSPPTACCGAVLKSGATDTPDNRKEQCVPPRSLTVSVITHPAFDGAPPGCINTAVDPPTLFPFGTDCTTNCHTAAG